MRDIKEFVRRRHRMGAAKFWAWNGCRFTRLWLRGLATGEKGRTVPYSERARGSFRCALFWLTAPAKVCHCGDHYVGGRECGNCEYGITVEEREEP